MSSDEDSSKKSVVWALSGNSAVMLLKFIAFALTVSSAMLAEALHSLGDVVNQIALLLGITHGSKKPDRRHPYGYGRARFLWNCFAAAVVAFLAGVTLYKGIGTVFHGHVPDYILSSESIFALTFAGFKLSITPLVITFAILGASLVIEGKTLLVAKAAVWKQKGNSSLIKYIRETSDPTGVAVFLEDFVAELGVATAVIGIVATKYFSGNPVFDGIAAVAIAAMMFCTALLLLYLNGVLLLGRSHFEIEEKIQTWVMELPSVERIHRLHTEIRGPHVVSIALWVELKEEAIYEHVSNGALLGLIGKNPREIVDETYNRTARLTDEVRNHIKAHLEDQDFECFVCVEAEAPRKIRVPGAHVFDDAAKKIQTV